MSKRVFDRQQALELLQQHTSVPAGTSPSPPAPDAPAPAVAGIRIGTSIYRATDDPRFRFRAAVQDGAAHIQLLFLPEARLSLAEQGRVVGDCFATAQNREFVPGEVVADDSNPALPAAIVPRGWWIVYNSMPCAPRDFLDRKVKQLVERLGS